jgi:histidinol-phosphate aminotransferase
LRNAIADRLGVRPENLILGNGSNEIIEFVAHAFLDRDDELITPKYSFICYKLIGQFFGVRVIETPVVNFQADLQAIPRAITEKTKVIFIANPNNPTGTLINQAELDQFISRVPENIVTVLDEAYFEFLEDPPNTLRHVREGRNLIVLRTFSKIHGLASLRVGYGIARPEIIEVLQKTRQPFNVNGIAQIAALAALDDSDFLAESKRAVAAGRAFLEKEFAAMKLEFVPSAGNFVFVRVGDGPSVFKKMLAQKIIVRPLVGYGLPEWLRITVGTTEQNQKCIAALKKVLG